MYITESYRLSPPSGTTLTSRPDRESHAAVDMQHGRRHGNPSICLSRVAAVELDGAGGGSSATYRR
jgi:hypothetical protein